MTIEKKLKTIAENQQKVYDAGFAAGQSDGGDTDAAYQEGYDAGIQAEYDRFWDAYQEKGAREDYTSAFAGNGWNAETFKPKYDIVPITPTQILSRGSFTGDIVEYLESIGIKLDFSKATSLVEMLYMTNVTRIGVIDTRSASNLNYILSYTQQNLKTVDLLILKEDGTQTFSNNSFIQATGLTNLTIQGKIGNTINLQWSPLSKASIESVMAALSDTTTGQTATFKKTAVDAAFSTDQWNALVATKSNWTITLA